jgi:hypothetical protein
MVILRLGIPAPKKQRDYQFTFYYLRSTTEPVQFVSSARAHHFSSPVRIGHDISEMVGHDISEMTGHAP